MEANVERVAGGAGGELQVARAEGGGRVLVTCDEDNAGSRTVIESNGGRLESVVDLGDGTQPKRRYWID